MSSKKREKVSSILLNLFLLGIGTFLSSALFANTAFAAVTDSPLGISLEAEKSSVSRFLLSDYRFNEDLSLDTNSLVDVTKSISVLNFNGTTNYLEIENNPVAFNEQFSIGAFIKPKNISKDQVIIAQGRSTNDHDYKIFVNSNNKISFSIRNSSNVSTQFDQTSDQLLEQNKWYFILATGYYNPFSNVTNFKILLNGETVLNESFSGTPFNTISGSPKIYIGSYDNSNYFDGLMDKVFISGSNLNDSQISEWNNSRAHSLPTIVFPSSFSGFWDFSEQAGTIAYDLSLERRHAALKNYYLSGWFKSDRDTGHLGSYGMQFDGIDDFITLDTTTGVFSQEKGALEIAFMINEFPSTGEKGTIFALSDQESDLNALRVFIGDNNKLYYQVLTAGVETLLTSINQNLETNKWYHFIVSSEASSGHKLYLNGVEASLTYQIGNSSNHTWFDSYSNFLYRKITLGSFKNQQKYLNFFSGSIQFVNNYPTYLDEKIVNTIYNFGKPKSIYQYSKAIDLEFFEINFSRNQGLIFRGDYSNTTAHLKNILLRGPPEENIANPLYYPNRGIELNNSNSFVSVSNDATLKNSDKFTIGVVFRYLGNSLPAGNAYLYREELSAVNEVAALYLNTAGKAVCKIKDKNNVVLEIISERSYADTLWHNLACSFNAETDEHYLYVDDETKSINNQSTSELINTSPANIFIGTRSGATNNLFIGEIDRLFVVKQNLAREQFDEISENQNVLINLLSSPGNSYLIDFDFDQTTDSFTDRSPNGLDISIGNFNIVRSENISQVTDHWQTEKMSDINTLDVSSALTLNFDGVNDFISVDTKEDLNSFNFLNNKIALEAWIKTGKADQYIISKSTGLYNSWNLSLNSGQPKFAVYSGETAYSVLGPKKINDNLWHHVVGVFADNTLKIAVDGEFLSILSDVNIASINNFPTDLVIGAYGDTVSNFFKGQIANINIYDTGLSAEEILYHYKNGETNLESNLRLALKLNEGGGRVVYDSSANKLFGTLYNFSNFPWFDTHASLGLNGSSDYLAVNGIPAFSTDSDLTFSVWLKPKQMTGTNIAILDNSNGALFDQDSLLGYKLVLEHVNSSNYKLKGAIGVNPGRAYTVTSSFVMTEDVWTNIFMRFKKSTGKIELLKDGEILAEESTILGAGNPTVYQQNSNFLLGSGNNDLIEKKFKGVIADFKIWTEYLNNDQVNLSLKRSGAVLPDSLLTNLKVDLPLNDGYGEYFEDRTNSNIGGTIIGKVPWIKNSSFILNRKNKKDHSFGLNLDFSKGEFIDLGPVLTTNANFAVEVVFSSTYRTASSDLTILDYGFYDSMPSGAKFKVELTPENTIKTTISDGNSSENNQESHQTFLNSITPERYNNLKIGYNFYTKLLEVYLNNSLILAQNTVIKLNNDNNHNMSLRLGGENGAVTYRLLRISQDNTNTIDNALDLLKEASAKKLEIDFSTVQSLEVNDSVNSQDFEIKNGGQWINIPKRIGSNGKDISEENLSKTLVGQIEIDGKGPALKALHTDDIELGSGDFALEFWISPYNIKGVYPILEKGKAIYGDTTIQSSLFIYLADGQINGWIGGKAPQIVATSPTLEPNELHHFILIRDNERSNNFALKYYYNGAWQNYWQEFNYDDTLKNQETLNIGFSKDTKNIPNLNPYFSGLIDEVRIFRRSYTQSELNTLDKIPSQVNNLSLTIPLTAPSASLISRYSFNDRRTISLKDSMDYKDGDITADLVRFFNNGARFDGTTGYVKVSSDGTNGSRIRLGNSGKFSIEAWVEVDEVAKDQAILYKGSTGTNPNYALYYQADKGFVCVFGNSDTIKEVFTGNENIETGIPHHVVCTYDVGNQIAIFVDGALRNTPEDISAFSTTTSTDSLFIGDDGDTNNGNNFKGKIYQIRFWNLLLSYDAITEHALNPFSYSYELTLDDLLSEWRFEEEDTANTLSNLYYTDLDGQVESILDIEDFWGEKQGKGFFDGNNDVIKIEDDDKYDFNSTEEFSLVVWFKAEKTQSDKYISLLSKGDPNNDEAGFSLGFDNELKLPRFKISDGNVANSKDLVGKTQIADGNYHQILVTRDPQDSPFKLKLFVDSVLQDEISASGINLANDRLMTIGALQRADDSFSNFFRGSIDEVRIYSKAMNEEQVFLEYISGSNSPNQAAYNLIIKNNSAQRIRDTLDIQTLLPSYLEISPEVQIFSAPELDKETNPNPLISGDLFNGLRNDFKFTNLDIGVNETLVLNFFVRLNEAYQLYMPEKISDLKIVSGLSSSNDSFASTVKVVNPNGINGGNNIEIGEQAHVQVRLLSSDTLSKYSKLSGNQKNSTIDFKNSDSSLEIGSTNSHSPLAIEPPTINALDRDDSEYIKIFKRKTAHPNLALEYLIPSNSFNKYFYSLPINNYDLRVQWRLADAPSSIDGFKWNQQQSTDDNSLSECFDNANNCIGEAQGQSVYNFNSLSTASSNRKYKLQTVAESYTLTGNAGDFGDNYYFTYIKPMQGKYKLKIRARDNIYAWGDEREIPFWIDSRIPISQLSITGKNAKVQNPSNQETGWWREGVNTGLDIKDDITQAVPSNLDNVSGIDFIDYWIYNAMDSHNTVTEWIRVNDNDLGAGGMKARWNFNEAGNTDLSDQTTIHNGTIQYTAQNYFWDQNGSGHFDGVSDHVSFTGDILDMDENLTLEAWIQVENSNEGVVFSKWDDTTKKSYKISIKNGEIYLYTSTDGSSTIFSRTNGAGIVAGTSYHIVVSKSGVTPAYYVNGVVKPYLNNVNRYLYDSNGPVFIGKQDKSSNPTFFKGRISELRIYSRAISDAEVLKHYNDGTDGIVTSRTDNDTTPGIIKSEEDIDSNGIFKMTYKTQDKATPPNQTGIKTHTVQIDKKVPISGGIALPESNITIGDNGWFKAAGEFGKGVMKVSFSVQEGKTQDLAYFDSGLKNLKLVHVVNERQANKFSIDWSEANATLRNNYGFGSVLSSGSNFYQSTTSVNSISCNDGSYSLAINEYEESNLRNISVYLGGCSELSPTEAAKNLQDAFNSNTNLKNFYQVLYLQDSKTFTIKNLGKRWILTGNSFNYSYGQYTSTVFIKDDLQFTSQGKHEIYFFAEDNAGNIENTINKIEFKVDTKLPTCPIVTAETVRPNAYAYKRDTSGGDYANHRNTNLLNYVRSGYDASTIDTSPPNFLDPRNNQGETNPFFMWPKSEDSKEGINPVEGINYSGNLNYSYLWEKADDDDFSSTGNITAIVPNSQMLFSEYKAIGNFNINDSESIISAHRGALMPREAGSFDDIPEPPIELSDDGKSFFLWIKVKDNAGNENRCGQAGYNGNGPTYHYSYGKAKRFTTIQMFANTTDEDKYIYLGQNAESATKFSAGPFIAGEEISFDKLYYNYLGNDPTSSVTAKIGQGNGGFESSKIVFFVNSENNYLSHDERYPIRIEEDFSGVIINNSYNPFRPNTGGTILTSYFRLEEGISNDYNIGATISSEIVSGKGSNILSPFDINNNVSTNPMVGRLLNFGIRQSDFSSGPGIVEISKGGTITGFHNMIQSPLSRVNPKPIEITRGFTNVAGHYTVNIALETSQSVYQYISIDFDILPANPNLNCADTDKGECSDILMIPKE